MNRLANTRTDLGGVKGCLAVGPGLKPRAALGEIGNIGVHKDNLKKNIKPEAVKKPKVAEKNEKVKVPKPAPVVEPSPEKLCNLEIAVFLSCNYIKNAINCSALLSTHVKRSRFLIGCICLDLTQDHPVPKKQLQLVGVTAMFLASKYEEMYPPEITDFAYVTDRAYTTVQIREMEETILRVLKFQLGRPLPLQFLRRASKIYEVTAEQHTLAKYLLELTMVDYEMIHFPPSMVASAALALTLKVLDAGEWDATLQHYMNYSAESLIPVMAHIAKNVVKVNEGRTKHMAVKGKYSTSKQMKIASIPQLKSSVVKDLAKLAAQ
uniref:Cyclin B1 n=1 Tax=Fundulus heteroclitus TaxID=8078 RepID=A0A3Q2NPE3_FUNHE